MWAPKLKLIGTDNRMVVTGGKGARGYRKEKGSPIYDDKDDLPFGGGNTMTYEDDVT